MDSIFLDKITLPIDAIKSDAPLQVDPLGAVGFDAVSMQALLSTQSLLAGVPHHIAGAWTTGTCLNLNGNSIFGSDILVLPDGQVVVIGDAEIGDSCACGHPSHAFLPASITILVFLPRVVTLIIFLVKHKQAGRDHYVRRRRRHEWIRS